MRKGREKVYLFIFFFFGWVKDYCDLKVKAKLFLHYFLLLFAVCWTNFSKKKFQHFFFFLSFSSVLFCFFFFSLFALIFLLFATWNYFWGKIIACIFSVSVCITKFPLSSFFFFFKVFKNKDFQFHCFIFSLKNYFLLLVLLSLQLLELLVLQHLLLLQLLTVTVRRRVKIDGEDRG